MTPSPIARRMISALALLTTLSLTSCAASSPLPSASAAGSPVPSASAIPSIPASEPASATPSALATTAAEPTESLPAFACVPSVTIAKTTDRAQITDVRVGTHAGYDRVTFAFFDGVPQTLIEGVLPPFYADPSNLPLSVAGSAFLKVTMTGATKVGLDGGTSYGGPTSFTPGFPQLVQLKEGGDFEAVSTWYIGLAAGACYRVLALAGPARLVIDIEH